MLKPGDLVPQWATIGFWWMHPIDSSKLQDHFERRGFWRLPYPTRLAPGFVAEAGKPLQTPAGGMYLVAAGPESPA
jgi:hypothetical protein